jgi:hypothetical protein
VADNSSQDDCDGDEKVSRRNFLKLALSTGAVITLSSLIPLSKVFGSIVTSNATDHPFNMSRKIGPDGVSFIYPTKEGGFTWYLSPDGFDSHFERGHGSAYKNIVKNPDGSFTTDNNSDVRFNLNVDPNYEDPIGGCEMNYADSLERGYTYKDNIDLDSVELTGFFNVKSPCSNSHGIYMRGPMNHHPSDTNCCQNFCYDSQTDPSVPRVIFTKQHPPGKYPDPGGEVKLNYPTSLVGKGWFGIKYVHIINSKESNADDPHVLLEQYINFTGDRITWVKVNQTIDNKGYKWGNSDAVCGGVPYQVGAWKSPRMVIKWYGCDVDFKWFSCRQIDSSGVRF